MDYRSLARDNNPHFYGKCTVLTPQLDVYPTIENYPGDSIHDGTDGKFWIVLNVAYVNNSELAITFPEKKVIKVMVRNQNKSFREVKFGRLDIYNFMLPDDVTKESLKAYRTFDDFLIIVAKPKPEEAIKIETTNIATGSTSSCSSIEAEVPTPTRRTTRRTAKLEEIAKAGPASEDHKSKDVKKKMAPVKDLNPVRSGQETTEQPKSIKPPPIWSLTPENLDLRLLPNLDPFMLRFFFGDLEHHIFQFKKVVEKSSFASPNITNSKEDEVLTATERRIRLLRPEAARRRDLTIEEDRIAQPVPAQLQPVPPQLQPVPPQLQPVPPQLQQVAIPMPGFFERLPHPVGLQPLQVELQPAALADIVRPIVQAAFPRQVVPPEIRRGQRNDRNGRSM